MHLYVPQVGVQYRANNEDPFEAFVRHYLLQLFLKETPFLFPHSHC